MACQPLWLSRTGRCSTSKRALCAKPSSTRTCTRTCRSSSEQPQFLSTVPVQRARFIGLMGQFFSTILHPCVCRTGDGQRASAVDVIFFSSYAHAAFICCALYSRVTARPFCSHMCLGTLARASPFPFDQLARMAADFLFSSGGFVHVLFLETGGSLGLCCSCDGPRLCLLPSV